LQTHQTARSLGKGDAQPGQLAKGIGENPAEVEKKSGVHDMPEVGHVIIDIPP
jgi:hypothetical protein